VPINDSQHRCQTDASLGKPYCYWRLLTDQDPCDHVIQLKIRRDHEVFWRKAQNAVVAYFASISCAESFSNRARVWAGVAIKERAAFHRGGGVQVPRRVSFRSLVAQGGCNALYVACVRLS